MNRLRALPLLVFCLPFAGCGTSTVRSMPANAATKPLSISTVQGAGVQSPLLGRRVTIEGIVTADLLATRGGVFVQSPRDEEDGDDATSDAVFVIPDPAIALAPGQRVRVSGTVAEVVDRIDPTASLTALNAAQVDVLGTSKLPQARGLTPPWLPRDAERLEGMRVTIAKLTLSGPYDVERDEQIAGYGTQRLFQPTELARPSTEAARTLAQINLHRTVLLKGRSARYSQLRERLPQPDHDYLTRAGGTVHGVVGAFEPTGTGPHLWVTGYGLERPSQRPRMPPLAHAKHYSDAAIAQGDTGHRHLVSVASINLENYFNGDGRGGGYPTARGAQDPSAQARQVAKLVNVVHQLRPHVAALMEVENDGFGPDSALAQLVVALNATEGSGGWRYLDVGEGPGNDAIRVALIYNANAVTPIGKAATLTDGPFAHHSRAPLAQAFRTRDGQGATLVIVANHFKSKGCRDATGDDADRGDGQSCWNATRVDSARRLEAWLKTDPTGTGGDLTVILGDLNSYRMEDPVVTLIDAGWRDAFEVARTERRYDWAPDGKGGWRHDPLTAMAAHPYSYVYNGQAGRLDHALLSPALARRLTGAVEWHINADEAEALGYRNPVANAVPTPWRSSDHDPLLLGFDLGQ